MTKQEEKEKKRKEETWFGKWIDRIWFDRNGEKEYNRIVESRVEE